jgi:chromosome segregation ATPase
MDAVLEKLNLLEERIARLVAALAAEKRRVSPLAEESETLKAQIAREKQKTAQLEERIAALRADEAEQRQSHDILKKRLERLLKELDEVPDQLAADPEASGAPGGGEIEEIDLDDGPEDSAPPEDAESAAAADALDEADEAEAELDLAAEDGGDEPMDEELTDPVPDFDEPPEDDEKDEENREEEEPELFAETPKPARGRPPKNSDDDLI